MNYKNYTSLQKLTYNYILYKSIYKEIIQKNFYTNTLYINHAQQYPYKHSCLVIVIRKYTNKYFYTCSCYIYRIHTRKAFRLHNYTESC